MQHALRQHRDEPSLPEVQPWTEGSDGSPRRWRLQGARGSDRAEGQGCPGQPDRLHDQAGARRRRHEEDRTGARRARPADGVPAARQAAHRHRGWWSGDHERPVHGEAERRQPAAPWA